MDAFKKCAKVILSCETFTQLNSAISYAQLYAKSQEGVADFERKVLVPLERVIAVKVFQLGGYGKEILDIMGES